MRGGAPRVHHKTDQEHKTPIETRGRFTRAIKIELNINTHISGDILIVAFGNAGDRILGQVE